MVVVAVACGGARPHAAELDVRADDGLSCHVYIVADAPVAHVVLWMGGTGTGSTAFVPDELRLPHTAVVTYDKPGVHAPFGDPAAVRIDDDPFRRHTQGTLIACARRALAEAHARFGAVPVVLRGHSEGALIALTLAPEVVPRAVVVSGVPLEPFADLLRRQLATRPALARAIDACDWSVMRRVGVSCAYLTDAAMRSSGRELFARLPVGLEVDVFAGDADDLTPAGFLAGVTTQADVHVHAYAGGHGGSPEAKRALAALMQELVR